MIYNNNMKSPWLQTIIGGNRQEVACYFSRHIPNVHNATAIRLKVNLKDVNLIIATISMSIYHKSRKQLIQWGKVLTKLHPTWCQKFTEIQGLTRMSLSLRGNSQNCDFSPIVRLIVEGWHRVQDMIPWTHLIVSILRISIFLTTHGQILNIFMINSNNPLMHNLWLLTEGDVKG